TSPKDRSCESDSSSPTANSFPVGSTRHHTPGISASASYSGRSVTTSVPANLAIRSAASTLPINGCTSALQSTVICVAKPWLQCSNQYTAGAVPRGPSIDLTSNPSILSTSGISAASSTARLRKNCIDLLMDCEVISALSSTIKPSLS